MNFYSVRHMTRFEYAKPVGESLMEVRIHPRTDTNQRCFSFTPFGKSAVPRLLLSRPPGQQCPSFRYSRTA